MKIYYLNNIYDYFKGIRPTDNSSQQFLEENYRHLMKSVWRIPHFVWDTTDGDIERDIYLYLGYILVCNEKAKSAIEQKMASDTIEFLKIDVDGKPLYFINVLSVANGALNLRRSKVDYFKDKTTIKYIREYAFNADFNYTPLFTIPEIAAGLFATDSFKDAVESNNLNGLDFQECKVVKDSFLKSIFK